MFDIERTDKPWGYELKWAHTDKYVGKVLHVNKDHRLSLQFHEEKTETIFVWKGKVLLTFGDANGLNDYTLLPGQSFHIPAGKIHRMKALEDSDIFEASTPEIHDVVRLEDDYSRST